VVQRTGMKGGEEREINHYLTCATRLWLEGRRE